ncbi:MAG: hypothetical protein GDA36_06495 [Rhodobacteraceae bacterium]|nr:hypothetical protein [Paracoccaceae bacterium]
MLFSAGVKRLVNLATDCRLAGFHPDAGTVAAQSPSFGWICHVPSTGSATATSAKPIIVSTPKTACFMAGLLLFCMNSNNILTVYGASGKVDLAACCFKSPGHMKNSAEAFAKDRY